MAYFFKYFSNSFLTKKALLRLLLILSLSFSMSKALAVDCDTLSGDAKKKCQDLEEKAKTYQKLYNLKVQQGATISKQIQLNNLEINKKNSDLKNAKNQAENLAQKVSDLETTIQEKLATLDHQKIVLSEIIRKQYENNLSDNLPLSILGDNSPSQVNDYLASYSDQIKSLLEMIRSTKKELENNQNDLESQRQVAETTKSDLQDALSDLSISQKQKQNLLSETQGDAEKYQQLLAEAEDQKLALFNFGSADNADSLIASVKNYSKPSSKYWSSAWYYSQRDSRWGNKRIGITKYLMKDYGCAITAVAMVFKSYGKSVTPSTVLQEADFTKNAFIVWPEDPDWASGLELNSSTSHGNISWSKIDSEIASGHPVIVYLKKTNGRGGHYVVIHHKDSKDYIVNDPYFGSNLYLSTSKNLVGKIGVDSGVTIDQMIIYK